MWRSGRLHLRRLGSWKRPRQHRIVRGGGSWRHRRSRDNRLDRVAPRFARRGRLSLEALGGLIGFGVAAVIAVKNLHGPLIPLASIGIIGLGALFGKWLSQRRSA